MKLNFTLALILVSVSFGAIPQFHLACSVRGGMVGRRIRCCLTTNDNLILYCCTHIFYDSDSIGRRVSSSLRARLDPSPRPTQNSSVEATKKIITKFLELKTRGVFRANWQWAVTTIDVMAAATNDPVPHPNSGSFFGGIPSRIVQSYLKFLPSDQITLANE